jgi:hypothetical protein
MATISVGEVIPAGSFKYVPYTPELESGVSLSFKKKIDALLNNASSPMIVGLRCT